MSARLAALWLIAASACVEAPDRAFFAAGGAADDATEAHEDIIYNKRVPSGAERTEAEKLIVGRALARATRERLESPGTQLYQEAQAREERLSAELCEFLAGKELAAEVRALLDLWGQRAPLNGPDFDNLTFLLSGLEAANETIAAQAILERAMPWVSPADKAVLEAIKTRLGLHDEVFDLSGAVVAHGAKNWTIKASQGRAVVLLALSAECRTCASWERTVKTLREKLFEDVDVVVLLVGARAEETAKTYEPIRGLSPVAVLADTNKNGPAARYGLRRLPALYFLDRSGRFVSALSKLGAERRVASWLKRDPQASCDVATSGHAALDRR